MYEREKHEALRDDPPPLLPDEYEFWRSGACAGMKLRDYEQAVWLYEPDEGGDDD